MNKKLTAKIQKLMPVVGENETVFSSSIAIEPPEKDLVLKKGSIYATFDISSPVPLKVALISRVINDVLYDSYYHSENISPIQSLEKAIVDINDKVYSLTAEAISTQPPNTKQEGKTEFNMVAGVLWGNVLYMVQYGNGKSFLMRDGEIKEVSATSEGNFSVASGVVKNGDVIILNTENFAQRYPPEKLLDASLSSNDLENSFASIILKFSVDEAFSEDEQIDFGVKTDKKGGKLKDVFQGSKDKKEKDRPIESLVDTTISEPSKQPAHQHTLKPSDPQPKLQPEPQQTTQTIAPQTSTVAAPTVKASKIKPKKDRPNIKLKSKRSGNKLNTKTLTIIVSVLLVLSVVITLLVRNNRPAPSSESEQQGAQSSLFVPKEFNKEEEQPQPEPEEPQPNEIEEPEVNEDVANKVARVDAQPFYDIKLADENALPTDIVAFPNTLVVTDSSSGKIFTSSTTTPKFVAEEQAFSGIKTAENYEGNLNFADSEGYKIYNLTSSSVENSYEVNTGLASRYLDNIYSVEDGKIIKYVPSNDAVESSTWAEDPANLSNAKDIVVSYSIYVATAQNNLVIYTSGEKSNFSVKGLDAPIKNLVGISANNNFENIYLADAGNNRIVVLDSEGNFVKQIKADEENAWSSIKSISVSADEATLYVLSGSKIFEVDLATANPPTPPTPQEPQQEPTSDTIDTAETP